MAPKCDQAMWVKLVESCRLNHTVDGADDAVELRYFAGKLLATGCGDFVVASATIAGSGAPLGGGPALEEDALQRGVERAFLHLKDIFRGALDGVGDFKAVEFAVAGEGFQESADSKVPGGISSRSMDVLTRHR